MPSACRFRAAGDTGVAALQPFGEGPLNPAAACHCHCPATTCHWQLGPSLTVRTFCQVLREYGVRKVKGDRYGGEWPREQFRKHGVDYDAAGATKSELYRDLLVAVNSGRVEMLDDQRLKSQLLSLERRVGRSRRDSIDHPPGGHDDLANAAAGALVQSAAGRLVLPVIFTRCDYELNHPVDMTRRCFVFKEGRTFVPTGHPECAECVGWLYVKAAYADHLARGGDRIGPRLFHARHVALNDWAAVRGARWIGANVF